MKGFTAACLAAALLGWIPASVWGAGNPVSHTAVVGFSDDEAPVAWLGIHLQELTPGLREALDLRDRGGVLVSDVVADSPAEKAGIRAGDVIYRIDDRDVRRAQTLTKHVRSMEPGEKVKIYFLRDGKEKSEKVTLGERDAVGLSETRKRIRVDHPGHRVVRLFEGPRLGVRVQTMNRDLAEYFAVDEGEGVLVVEVLDDTPAEKAEMKSGDVIVEIEGKKIGDAGDIRHVLGEYEEGDRVKVEIVRKGNRRTLEVEVEDGERIGLFGDDFRPFGGDLGPLFVWPRHLDSDGSFEIPQDDLEKLREDVRELREELRNLKQKLDNT